MSMHNQGTILAVHQRNSYLYIGLDVENRKEKESGVQRSQNSFHAADISHAQPRASSLQGQVLVGPCPNWGLRGKLMRG
jgi:4'-phosphopantetheinyl transferase EntD